MEDEGSYTNFTVSRQVTWKACGHISDFGLSSLAGKYSKKIKFSVRVFFSQNKLPVALAAS